MAILDTISASATVAYGFRLLKTGAANAIRVKNSVTAVETDLAPGFSKATADALKTAGQELEIIKFYDQSGVGTVLDLGVGATVGLLKFDTGDFPYLEVLSGVRYRTDTSVFMTFTYPKYFILSNHSLVAPDQGFFAGFAGGYTNLVLINISGRMGLNNSDQVMFDVIPANTWTQLTAYWNSGNERAFRDGAEMTIFGGTVESGVPATGCFLDFFRHQDGGQQWTGKFREFIFIDGVISDADREAIEDDQMGAYALPVTILTTTLPNPQVGAAYDQTLAYEGGSGPYTWNHESGTIPPGMSFNETTGKFEGTPTTEGPYPGVVIRLTAGDASFDEQTYNFTVEGFAGFSVSGLNGEGNLETNTALVITDESVGATGYEYEITNSGFTDQLFSTSAEPTFAELQPYLKQGVNTIKQIVTNGSGTDEASVNVTVVSKEVSIVGFVPVGGKIELNFSATAAGVTIAVRLKQVTSLGIESGYTAPVDETSTGGGGGGGELVFDSELDGGAPGDTLTPDYDGGAPGDSFTTDYDGGLL
jgi:hypothetical protein